METATYEEQFGRIQRQAKRALRRVRWTLGGRCILAHVAPSNLFGGVFIGNREHSGPETPPNKFEGATLAQSSRSSRLMAERLPTYEDQFDRAQRCARRLLRGVRWTLGGRRILVELRWRLGDEVMALPIYEALRAKYPDCHTTVLCSYPDLLTDNPFVDAVNQVDRDPDRYLVLRSGPRDVYRLEHYAQCAGVPVPETRPRLYYEDWSTPLLDGIEAPIVAVSSGASWPTKRWPIDRWVALCRALEGAGYAIVELGRNDERIGVGVGLLDQTTIREAACVLHAARLFVCCDSGLMHLALAAGTRTLALFGPTEPTILIRDEPNLAVMKNEEPCQGCWNISLEMEAPGVCPRNRPMCLESITTEAALERAHALLRCKE